MEPPPGGYPTEQIRPFNREIVPSVLKAELRRSRSAMHSPEKTSPASGIDIILPSSARGKTVDLPRLPRAPPAGRMWTCPASPSRSVIHHLHFGAFFPARYLSIHTFFFHFLLFPFPSFSSLFPFSAAKRRFFRIFGSDFCPRWCYYAFYSTLLYSKADGDTVFRPQTLCSIPINSG